MSLSSSLQIAVQALLADQGGLSVVSNNIANVNTPGYSREVANLEEAPPFEFGGLQFGSGVELASITGVRDNVLQLRLNQEAQTEGRLNTLSNGLNQIQPLFNEAAGTGLQSLLSNFFNSFTQLSSDPTDLGLRQGVISSAQSLAAGFNQTAAALVTQQQNSDEGVVQTVTSINGLTQQIAALNAQITSPNGQTSAQNAFIDQRNELINQLSQLVDVQSIVADGNSLTLTTSGGTALVVGGQSFNLQTQTDPTTGFQDVYAQGQNITSTITGGNLAGDLQLRDQEIPSIQSSLDTLANSLATNVNAQSAKGFDLNGAVGGNIFVPPAAVAGSALNLTVAISDPTKIAASSDGTLGNNVNATALANIQNQTITGGQTPLNFYSGIVFQVGNDASTASNSLSAEQLLVQQLQDQQGAESGVSVDEEAANLLQYQSAYNSAAEVAAIVSNLMETAITMISGT
ncbi:MAG TPA: flagellar hook-associated protein FlgK [Candidatus Sulfotelmatobacter sp.]|nr:flagellar hook-associated protein FlgK [Candidatus Sulfotelmatobacter sp.]